MRLLFDELAGCDASVRIDAIPDDNDGSGQVLAKLFEELDDVFGTNGPWNQAEEEAGSATVRGVGRSSNRREVLPVAEAMFQHRGLPPRRPRTLDRGPLRESTLVDEDDRRALACGVFFTAGQVVLTQRSIAASSRSRARVVGFCRDHPSLRSTRQTWPGW